MATVKLKDIKWGKRKRKLHQESVESLKVSLPEQGQLNPIIVRAVGRKYKGVAGLHRWTAMTELGWEEAEVKFQLDQGTKELNDIADEMVEIDENFFRKGLTPVESNEHLLQREELYLKRAELIEQREAELRKVEADKALKAAKTKEEKEAAKLEKKRAVDNAGRRRRKRANVSENVVRSRKGVQAATEEAIEVTGLSAPSIRKRKQTARKTREVAARAGVEVNDLVDTSLDQQSELNALAKLAEKSPSKSKSVVGDAVKGDKSLASKGLKKVESQAKKSGNDGARRTEAGMYQELAKLLSPAVSSLRKAHDLCMERGAPKQLTRNIKRNLESLGLDQAGCRTKAQLAA